MEIFYVHQYVIKHLYNYTFWKCIVQHFLVNISVLYENCLKSNASHAITFIQNTNRIFICKAFNY